MSDIEEGHVTRTSTSRATNGKSRPQGAALAAPTPVEPSNEPASPRVHLDSPLAILRQLRDESDAAKRLEVEALFLAHLSAGRATMVRPLCQLVREWMRSPRNTGAEAILLSLLSAVPKHAPELLAEMTAFAVSLDPRDVGAGQRLFADLSAEGQSLLSFFNMYDYPTIIASLGATLTPRNSVGAVVRACAVRASDTTKERWMIEGRHQCIANYAFAGSVMGLMIGSVGGPAGAIAGSFAGFADGLQIGSAVCNGLELSPAPSSTGPFLPDPPVPESNEALSVIGRRGGWCWTWPGSPLPWLPPPITLPHFPPFDGPFWPRPMMEAAAATTPGGTTLGAGAEALGPNCFLVRSP